MTKTTLVATTLLALVAVAHVVRLIFKAEATIGGATVPMWASVLAAVVAGGVAVQLWREHRPK
jgi:hypothetical protein